MKHSGFIIFFAVVLTVYTLVNVYIIRRGWQALPATGSARMIFLLITLFCALAYPVGRICERCLSAPLGSALIHIGAYYLAIMVFAFFMLILIDLARIIDWLIPFIEQLKIGSLVRLRLMAFIAVSGLALLLTIIGAINARYPRRHSLHIHIDKACPRPSLRLAIFSDMHLGTLIPVGRMQKLAQTIHGYSPDLILIAGDLFDEDAVSLAEKNILEGLRQLRAPLGVYAIPGNHEYFSGIEGSVRLMEQADITVLRDRAIKIADAFYLIGRDDRTLDQFGGARASLSSLLKSVDASLPLLLLDHQPFHLEEAAENGIDLLISGHTHHGQIFPFNLITDLVYEVSWGYARKGATHIYVSSGAGTWGPPVRIGNRPEFVIIDCTFQN